MDTIDILSWNVNGLRAAARKGFSAWLEQTAASVVLLQEVRAQPAQLPDDVRAPLGWHAAFVPAERPGYAGVAIYSRAALPTAPLAIGDAAMDREGRLMSAQCGDLRIVNGYFPNGSGRDRSNDRVPEKIAFYDQLRAALAEDVAQGRPVLVGGDFNTARQAIDLARPRDNEGTSGFLPEERAAFERWLADGWIDTFRHLHPATTGAYSWWSQRFGVRERNVGWRIDGFLASPAAAARLQAAWIEADVRGSDHCPVGVRLRRQA